MNVFIPKGLLVLGANIPEHNKVLSKTNALPQAQVSEQEKLDGRNITTLTPTAYIEGTPISFLIQVAAAAAAKQVFSTVNNMKQVGESVNGLLTAIVNYETEEANGIGELLEEGYEVDWEKDVKIEKTQKQINQELEEDFNHAQKKAEAEARIPEIRKKEKEITRDTTLEKTLKEAEDFINEIDSSDAEDDIFKDFESIKFNKFVVDLDSEEELKKSPLKDLEKFPEQVKKIREENAKLDFDVLSATFDRLKLPKETN